ncbi:MAG: Glutamyl-tRNA(Gln) amidotransferase subunit C [Gammaproteobacteria bacterium]|nr:Glutamyl-tRNA(Gln) amidotransferase subunit C [Gammaproteobacteria bacterium]
MALDRKTVIDIATLARIGIDPDNVDDYASELSKILKFVAQMDQVDTEKVEPLTHPQDRQLRMRMDRVTETDQREGFQQLAPAVEAGLYLVPRVIE